MLHIRLISSEECPKCKMYRSVLDKNAVKYEVYDADKDENQKQLDSWRITDMPVVQIINSESKNIVWQFMPGAISIRAINFKIQELSRKIQ